MTRRLSSVAARIAAGYGVLLGLIAAVGIAGAIAVEMVSSATSELHRHPFAVTNALAEVRRGAVALNGGILEALAFPDQAASLSWAKDFAALELATHDQVRLAAERYLGPRQDAESLEFAWVQWTGMARQIVARIAEGDIAAAQALYRGKSAKEFSRAIATAYTMRSFAQGKAEQLVAEGLAAKQRLRLWVFGCLALALTIGLAVSVGVARGITRPLAKLRLAMDAISNGDLYPEVGETERRDEIGEMAQALAALQRELQEKHGTELKYATVFRTCPDVIAVTTREGGVFLEVNEAFERVLGFSNAEVLGRPSLEVGAWEAPAERARMVAALGDSGRLVNFEGRLRRKSGEIFTSLMSVGEASLDGRRCLIIVARDISDRGTELERRRRRTIASTPCISPATPL